VRGLRFAWFEMPRRGYQGAAAQGRLGWVRRGDPVGAGLDRGRWRVGIWCGRLARGGALKRCPTRSFEMQQGWAAW